MKKIFAVAVHAVIGLVMSATVLAQPVPPPPAANNEVVTEEAPFSLTISGGISLGSYEAGVNWALAEYMKKTRRPNPSREYLNPELKGLSGASAGSINAVMTALTWCTDPSKADTLQRFGLESDKPIDGNLVRDAWLSVGVDALLPHKDAYVNPGGGNRLVDSVFARSAFETAITKIKTMVELQVFRECNIPIGMMATRVEPAEVSVDNVKVGNSRFAFVLRFVATGDGSGHFETTPVDEKDPDFGNVVYLPGNADARGTLRLGVEDVIRLIYASSAFPVAFGKVHLSYCTSREGGVKDPRCPRNTYLAEGDFVDGGVFDNIPLGTARALVEPSPLNDRDTAAWNNGGRREWFFFISPSSRRNIPDPGADPFLRTPSTFGLAGITSFLPGAITTMDDYELYNVLRSRKWSRQIEEFSRKISNLLEKEPRPRNSGSGRIEISGAVEGKLTERQVAERLGKDDPDIVCDSPQHTLTTIEKILPLLQANYLPFQLQGRMSTLDLVEKRYRYLGCLAGAATALGDDSLAHDIRQTIPDRFADRKVKVTTRYSPITGAYLGHFGAFLDKPFREFDYYAGIYDAVNDIADFACLEENGRREECIGRKAKEAYDVLGIHGSPQGRTIFCLVGGREHADHSKPDGPWRWLNDEAVLPHDEKMELIFRALVAASGTTKEDGSNARFEAFVRYLAKKGYRGESGSMRRIISRAEDESYSWYAPMVGKITKRLQALQAYECDAIKGGRASRFAMATLALGLGRYFGYDDYATPGPSSEPRGDGWYKLLPYELDADVANGGFSISYMPQLRWRKFSLDLKLTPAGYNKFGRDRVGFSEGDLYLALHLHDWYHSLGVGPTLNYTWQPAQGYDRVNLGIAGFLELARTFRLTFGVRSLEHEQYQANNFYVLFGITDIPGLINRIIN